MACAASHVPRYQFVRATLRFYGQREARLCVLTSTPSMVPECHAANRTMTEALTFSLSVERVRGSCSHVLSEATTCPSPATVGAPTTAEG